MKLYQYKAKYLKRLILYQPRTSREKELKDLLIAKLETLRTPTMPYFLRTLHEVLAHENVSEEFKAIVRSMIEEAPVEGEEE